MALPNASAIRGFDGATTTTNRDTDPHGYAESMRQVLEALPAARESLGIDADRMGRIRFDAEWGIDDEGEPVSKVIVPIGRRNDDAAREILRYIRDNTTDLEFDGVLFVYER